MYTRTLDSNTSFGWLVGVCVCVCVCARAHILDSSSFIYLFWAVLGLCCRKGFSQVANRDSSLVVRGFLIAVASLVGEHRL